ncbi:hypothetical protein BJY00DRAFT_297587 [Aspergillus carlsbadensis]|nr:hypothetical protein BJY00DRAFT_297587 [Aspergillus carlsbadensis]
MSGAYVVAVQLVDGQVLPEQFHPIETRSGSWSTRRSASRQTNLGRFTRSGRPFCFTMGPKL